MSTIKIEFWSEDKNEIAQFLDALSRVNGNSCIGSVKNIDVVEAEEVKTPEKKAAAPRTRTAKKPEPVLVEEDEDEEDPLGEESEDDTETITEDDVKAMLAKKVATNRDAIVKQLKSYGASKISELESSSYKDFYDFMAKLK